MKATIPHLSGYRIRRSHIGAILLFLFSSLYALAQSTSDFDVTASPTPSTCLQNGKVEIIVAKKPGAPTNYSYKAHYNLLDSKGNSATNTLSYVDNNIIENLLPGNYQALVRIEILNNGLKIDLNPIPVTVTSTYKNPTVKINVERKTLNHYRPQGSQDPVGTGIFSISVLDGNGPYTLSIEDAPSSYKGAREFSLIQNKPFYIYKVPQGTYRFKVSDGCGDAPIQTIQMTSVARDLPQNSSSDMPFRSYASMTSEMRENHCGWMRITYDTHSSPPSPDLTPYLWNRDTLAAYYDYAWQTNSDTKRGQRRDYHEFFKTPPFESLDYGSDRTAIYYHFPDGINYKKAGRTDQYWPRVFLKVKGSSEEMPEGYNASNYDYSGIDIDYEIHNAEPCTPTYNLRVRPRSDHDVLLCLPITVTLVNVKKNASDSTPLEAPQEIVLTKDVYDYVPFPKPLDKNKRYILTTTSANGQSVSVNINETEVHWSTSTSTSNNYCKGTKSVYFYIYGRYYNGRYTDIRLGDHKIRLIRAPKEYVPMEGALTTGADDVYEVPQSNTSTTIYPLSPKASIFSSKYYESLPEGKYEFEITDPCGNKYYVSTTYTQGATPRKEGDLSRFAPRIAKEECGRVRIYPFAGGYEGILKENGVSVQPYFKITSLPRGIDWKDIRSNIPETNSTWRSYRTFTTQYSGISDPKDIYIDFPATEGHVKLKLYYNSDYTLDCLPETTLSLKNPPLSYNRDTYIGYSCPSGTSGFLHITPINCVGDATIEIYDTETGQMLFQGKGINKKEGVKFDLKGTADKRIPSHYRVKIKDELCQNTSEELLRIYSLSSPSIIRSRGQQRSFCEGSTISLDVINLGEQEYRWTLPDGSSYIGRNLVISNATQEHSGQYRLQVSNILCDGVSSVVDLTIQVSVAPRELWWRKDAQDQNWNNIHNWARSDGRPIPAVPASCTDVHIPAVVDNGYPDLSPDRTLRDNFGDPICGDIHFHYGAQLGSPQLLTYERAFIDYNFGEMRSGGATVAHHPVGHPTADSKLLARNRWYMLATPLNNVVSGDFSLAGYPKTYQRYIVASQKDNSVTNVSFTQPLNTMVQSFNPPAYHLALALKVAGWEPGRVGYDDHKNLNMLNGIIRIPFFADATRSAAYPLHSYDEVAGYSTFRYYNEATLAPLAYTDRISRGKGVYPYRFVYEQYNPLDPSASAIASIPDGGAILQGYELPLGTLEADAYFMVGNPFMTPIDFDKLWEFNKQTIYPYYYVFQENQWRMYSVEAPEASTWVKEIPPLQAVLLRYKSSSSSQLRFPTSGSKSVLLPSWSTGQGGQAVEVQSAKESFSYSILPIHLREGVVRDKAIASAFIHWNEAGDNIPALTNEEYAEVPLVYIVAPDCREGAVVLYPKKDTRSIEVGVRAGYASEMVLDFSDMDKDSFEQLTLVDRQKGAKQDLLSNEQYEFTHDPNGVDPRFLLQFKCYGDFSSSPSPIDDVSEPELTIYRTDEACVVKANQPIYFIELYDLAGLQLYRYQADSNAHSLEYRISRRELPDAVVIKITLKSGYTEIRKLQL